MFKQFLREDPFYLTMLIVIVIIIVVRQQSEKKGIRYRRKKSSKYNKEEEFVLDLVFNNEETIGSSLILLGIVSFCVSALINGVLFLIVSLMASDEIIFSSNLLDDHRNKVIYVFAFSFILVFIHFYNRSQLYLHRIFSFKKKFQYKDIIFTPEFLKLSPFLCQDPSINPELAFTFTRSMDVMYKIDYVQIPWDELHLLEVVDRRQGKHTHCFYKIKTNNKEYLLNRRCFNEQEHKFFDLLHAYSNVEISNNSYWREPFKKIGSGQTRMILYVLVVALLMMFLNDR